MNTQPINNISFGTKVFVMPNANKIMEKYFYPTEKRAINRDIKKLEQTNINDVVILDSNIYESTTVIMTCYKMVKDKLFKSDYIESIPLGYKNCWLAKAYQSINCNEFSPVKKSCFDKNNPMLDIIKNACKPDDGKTSES